MAHVHAHDEPGHSHPVERGLGRGAGHARDSQRRLLGVIVFGLLVLVGEVIAGLAANSLVLLSDAVHMSTDVAAIALAYVAARIAARPATAAKSYGYHRAETVAAFLNALVLWVLGAYFIYEAWTRLSDPPEVRGGLVAIVGGITLAANLGMAVFLHRGSGHSLNVRSAYLHVLADALGSLAALVAGLGMAWYGATWLDPVATLFVAALILVWTWRLTNDTLHILLEGTPVSVKADEVRDTIIAVDGVRAVHDLHVWSLTTGVNNLSAHIVVQDARDGPRLVRAIRERLRSKHDLTHVTIEVEEDDGSVCEGCN